MILSQIKERLQASQILAKANTDNDSNWAKEVSKLMLRL